MSLSETSAHSPLPETAQPEQLDRKSNQGLRPRLTREEVLTLIQQHGGPDGLDLSRYDLSGVNLSKLNLSGIVFGTVDKLKDSDVSALTSAAILEGTLFERSTLRRANFGRTNLRGAKFYHADLTEATLWAADATGADFRKAVLVMVDLYSTDLRDCRLIDAQLSGANLFLVNVAGATIARNAIAHGLIQESVTAYREYFERWYLRGDANKAYVDRHIDVRYTEASDIYMNLKNGFLDAGRYDDASWAYFKERQTQRKSFSPLNARRHHADRTFECKTPKLWFWFAFYVEHLSKWALSFAGELSTGYGERPLRVLAWCLFAIAVFPILYWLSQGIAQTSGSPLRPIDFFQYSLAAFSTIGFPDLVPVTDIAKTLTSIEALSGIAALALLMYSLGKRIGRN